MYTTTTVLKATYAQEQHLVAVHRREGGLLKAPIPDLHPLLIPDVCLIREDWLTSQGQLFLIGGGSAMLPAYSCRVDPQGPDVRAFLSLVFPDPRRESPYGYDVTVREDGQVLMIVPKREELLWTVYLTQTSPQGR